MRVPDLGSVPLPADAVGLLEGIASTRSIRQPFQFVVLTDGPKAQQAKSIIAESAPELWGGKRASDGYDRGSGAVDGSPKARMAATMQPPGSTPWSNRS
ncbi:MAG: hypothetical protein WDA60_04140 [Acidimicrobiia bacterium]|jgi:hypothetical protein